MKLVWILLIVLIVDLALVHGKPGKKAKNNNRRRRNKPRPALNVNDLCARKKCNPWSTCRVFTSKYKCAKPVAKCSSCVADDIDKVCKANQYLKAVLVPSYKPWRGPTPHFCDLENVKRKVSCPTGSVCVDHPDYAGIGVCCYGKPPAPTLAPVSNDDEVQGTCRKPCDSGYSCQRVVTRCGRLSFGCRPEVIVTKPGLCPHIAEASCPSLTAPTCQKDNDCSGTLKCCPTPCDKSVCLTPITIIID